MMDMDLPHGPRHGSSIRSFSGCWTCRLRRKKCDEKRPVCDGCASLFITCHYGPDKPEWMDGGVRQEEMAEQLKREVKEMARRRRGERAFHISGDRDGTTDEGITGDSIAPSHALHEPEPTDPATTPLCDFRRVISDIRNDGMEPCPQGSMKSPQRGTDCALTKQHARESMTFSRSDTILLMFYLEHLLPFLFPFYKPPILQGGKAWVLEMMISSPVVRQATLCQSSYFFSLARGATNHDVDWETVLSQTRDAFGVLRRSLQLISGSEITEHLHGAVRIMASIMQVQRFEIAVLSFHNCQAHLNAALALFRQIISSSSAVEPVGPNSGFKTVINRLGPPSWILPTYGVQVPSAEQAAFRFSSALLILDDIISSTVLQEQPRLYEYHHCLLGNIDGTEPAIDLEAAVGCQNWVLLQIGEIAVLDAWKQQCNRAGNLNVMEMVRRATVIKDSLETDLLRLETGPAIIAKEASGLLDVFVADYYQQSKTPTSQTSLVTRVWAHAALIYLLVVVSGWQPASCDVRYHVDRIIDLLTHQISPAALLRTMVWPFCVAGCLAEPSQEAHLRGLVEALQPPSVFGTVRKALEIMENAWRNRDIGDIASRDLATCFRSQGDLVLLV